MDFIQNEKSPWNTCPADMVEVNSSDLVGNFLESAGSLEHIVKSRIWLTSDTHFSHKNILKYEATYRPFANIDQMNMELVKRWNERVRPEDVVFHLGDFAFAGKTMVRTLVSKLNGHIHLLMGNHDRRNGFDWVALGFTKVYEFPFLLDGKFILSHEPLLEIPEGKVNVYGHVHGHPSYKTVGENSFCACVERHGCSPVAYDCIKGLFPDK